MAITATEQIIIGTINQPPATIISITSNSSYSLTQAAGAQPKSDPTGAATLSQAPHKAMWARSINSVPVASLLFTGKVDVRIAWLMPDHFNRSGIGGV